MDWWTKASEAAEKAKNVAKVVSQKGMEFAEATAEEASKKLKDLNLHESIGGRQSVQKGASTSELEAYGITAAYIEYVRSLNYSTFRDFPSDQVIQEPGKLNPWQVRHSTLVVINIKEVDELRFVLCPRYMDDDRFWAVYYTLARKHLPEAAFTWAEGDELPVAPSISRQGLQEDKDIFTGIGTQLQTLGKKLHQATKQHVPAAGLELTSLLSGGGGDGTSTDGAQNLSSGKDTATPGASQSPAPMLQSDPDLEAYLQVAISEALDGGELREEDGNEGVEFDEDGDLDLDEYINELSAEVEAEDAANGEHIVEHTNDSEDPEEVINN